MTRDAHELDRELGCKATWNRVLKTEQHDLCCNLEQRVWWLDLVTSVNILAGRAGNYQWIFLAYQWIFLHYPLRYVCVTF